MSKYRLSYLQNGGFISVDLSKLECLKEYNETDIEIIDKFTSNFKNKKELLNYLIQNQILQQQNQDINLQLTIDKKVKNTNIKYNKPIFNSDKLIFMEDKEKLNATYGIKTIRNNLKNIPYMLLMIENYKEKYQNAYNRIDGSSSILGYLNYIYSILKKIHKNQYITNSENKEFQDCINELIEKEIYKFDKNNIKKLNYRGIHDFILLDKDIKNKLNSYENKIEESEEKEEFLTQLDYDRANCKIFGIATPSDINKLSNAKRSDFTCLQEYSKKLIKKNEGDC